MIDAVNQLAKCITDHGYDVEVQHLSNGVLFSVIKPETSRESLFAFNSASYYDVCGRIARKYCSEDQLMKLRRLDGDLGPLLFLDSPLSHVV